MWVTFALVYAFTCKDFSAWLLQQTAKQSRCILRLLIFFAWCLASGAVLYIFCSFTWMNRSVGHHLLAHWRSLRELERIHALVICIFLQYRMNADLFSLGCALLFLSLYFVFAIFRFVHTIFTVKKSVVTYGLNHYTWICRFAHTNLQRLGHIKLCLLLL